jgi:(1->4)-alpha-D-glucan 1-alpha-D-glucosylmutase
MSGEINTLGHYLNSISERDRLTRDFTLNSLINAITEVIAFFPVYRTYTNSWPVREKDGQYIETAVVKARRKNPSISSSIFDFLHDVLLLHFPDHACDHDKIKWLNFVMKFQQITGPVMAKGMEDTAFYVYNRLVSLNEVGGMPDRFGITIESFHNHNLERGKSFPHTLNTSTTHDTKRGEDVRARINALSEIPEKWRKAIVRWSRLNKRRRKIVEGQPVPDRNEEYLLYQTLVGAWPTGEMKEDGFSIFRGRIREFMIKAVREAKINSSWINPNTTYEDALAAFIDAILAFGPGNEFLKEFRLFQGLIARWGAFNSISQTLLKIASPGVPDFYQGTELWDLTLVDPDNRRPVDFNKRSEALAALKKQESKIGPRELIQELLAVWEDGRIKLYLTHLALSYRRENRELFETGEYIALEASGDKARHVCAFARVVNHKKVIVVAPRFMSVLIPEPEMVPFREAVWGNSYLTLPSEAEGRYWHNVLTDETVEVMEREGNTILPVAEILACAPVALLATAGD